MKSPFMPAIVISKHTQQYIHLSGDELAERVRRATQLLDKRNKVLLERIRGNRENS